MRGLSPPKRNERGCNTALKTAEVPQTYYTFLLLQVERGVTSRNGEVKGGAADVFHQQDERCCVRCGAIVCNRNLGGFERRSALSGWLWCLHCC
jgi:hypothetical protein